GGGGGGGGGGRGRGGGRGGGGGRGWPGGRRAGVRSPPRSARRLSVPSVGDPGAPRSERYAAPRAPRPAGTNPRASTPMSPPERSPESATSVTAPVGANAMMRPVTSSAAIRSPPKRPNDFGATTMPPSTCGAPWVTTVVPPRQSIAYTVVALSNSAVTRRRYPKRPTGSNVMPEGNAPGGRSRSRVARPAPVTRTTPGVVSASSANTSSRWNEHFVCGSRRDLGTTAMYGSPPAATSPPGPPANSGTAPPRPRRSSPPRVESRSCPSDRGPTTSTIVGTFSSGRQRADETAAAAPETSGDAASSTQPAATTE